MATFKATAGGQLLVGTKYADHFWDNGFSSILFIGGTGNDIYTISNSGTLILEFIGEGRDLVYSSVSYALPDDVENLTLTGATSINATGNDEDNVIRGNRGNNILDGGGNTDGNGTDTIIGGGGHDTFIIHSPGDHIMGGGNIGDVIAFFSIETPVYTLPNGFKTITLHDDGEDCIVNGNNLGNVLACDSNGNNTFDGKLGIDTMIGGDGDDTYFVHNSKDVIIDTLSANPYMPADTITIGTTQGNTVLTDKSFVATPGAQIDCLFATGKAALTITGNDTLIQYIQGNSGNDTIHGGTSLNGLSVIDGGGGTRNTLWGGDSGDLLNPHFNQFVFDADTYATKTDWIMNYNTLTDVIDVSLVLDSYDPVNDVLSDFVRFVDSGQNSIMYINAEGTGGAWTNFHATAVIYHQVGLSGQDLVDNGHLIVVQS